MAITKKQKQRLNKIFENVSNLLDAIADLGGDGEISHKDIKGEFFIVTGKELGVLDDKIFAIYSTLQNFCEEMELDNGKA
jgi:hypothetical protein